jgi:hypothetical protein
MRFFYIALFILLSFSTAISQQKSVSCGTRDDNLPEYVLRKMAELPAILQQQKARSGAGEMNICRIAVEIDYTTYVEFDRDTNAIFRKVLEDIQQVSKVYEKEINTRMVVTGIRIFKNAKTDPFAESDNAYAMLDVLTRLSPANQNFDKRAHFYSKQVTFVAGLAFINGAISVSPLGSPQVMMHEFGHNFASPHTHHCSWPGGPIDFCSVVEGGDCYDKSLEGLTDRSGTIMSYCASEPTFHPLCRALMRDHADNSFAKIKTTPNAPKLTPNSEFSKGDFLIWPAVTNALSYEVTYSTNADFSNGKTVSVPINGFQVKEFTTGQTVFFKVKAINTFGSSSWSEAVEIKIGTPQLSSPDILEPASSSYIATAGEPFIMSYSEVPGATGYEIQVTNSDDYFFSRPYYTAMSGSSRFQYKLDFPTTVKWRVRAYNAQGKGKWSDAGYFSANPSPGYRLHIPVSEKAPTSFPFFYAQATSYAKVNISIADNQAFTNPIFSKEYSSFSTINDFIPNLPANSQLFFKVEEWNQTNQNFPLRKMVDYVLPFKTGNDVLPANLTFLSGLDPDVFDQQFPRIAVTKESLWVGSPGNGFVKVNQSDLSYKIFNRKNTSGLIGFSPSDVALKTDDSLKLHIMSYETNTSFRTVGPVRDVPDANTAVNRRYSDSYFVDYNPSHKIYWNEKTIYKEANQMIVPMKTMDTDRNIRQVKISAGKMWVLVTDYNGHGELLLLDPISGAELERINTTTHPELLPRMEQFALGKDGKLLVQQYDPNIYGSRLSLWDNKKWSIVTLWDAPFSGGTIQAIANSPSGDFYVMTSNDQTRVFKYDAKSWKKLGADIPLRYFANTIVPDQNENVWITGLFGVTRLSVTQLDLVSTDKRNYCEYDTITVTMSLGDKVNAGNPFTVSLKKMNGETASVPNLMLKENKVRFVIPNGFTGSDVELRVKSAGPEINSGNALQLTIRELPVATLSVNKSVLIPLVDTTTVSIKLTGEKPWAFTTWNGDSISTELSTYTRPYVLQNPLGENLSISGLKDKYCYNRNLGNSIQIQANLITGVSEPSWPKVKVYPNPNADKMLLEFEQYNNKPSKYHIADLKGVIVDSMQVHEKLTEWDISKLNAGIYVLWTVHNGHKRSWKIVKN